MLASNPNDVKIYNLSAGKTLPEWLSERKRRSLIKKNLSIRRRIELIQDFEMPAVSTSIRVSKDGHYIFATGIYKPRLKCFDVDQLTLKFERCFDSEVVTFESISDDYSKLVFLHCDRNIEFHAAYGKYYRLKIPRFGRDMQYHYPSCDLFVVGTSNEIFRLNLERGQFMQPFISDSVAINKCTVNPEHHLLLIGNDEGKVEAWDPRVRNKVGTLDCGFSVLKQNNSLDTVPAITALKCQGGLTLGVGTVSGQVLLYDIRSNNPLIIKDHMYGLPIRNIEFHKNLDLVYSMDSSIVKIWEKNTGKIYTSVESTSEFNDLCIVPDTGMFFIANESPKIQTYYIPSLGPAPKWCGFLDNLTEELEELDHETIYDDYKFVTEQELDNLGLSHLKGTNLLRAYMHGFFMDVRLYRKARDVVKPFEYDEYKKKKIKEKINEERPKRVQIQSKLPAVNKDLALKHMEIEAGLDLKKKKKSTPNLMNDKRFGALFENPDFQVDSNCEEFMLLNPVISQLSKTKKKKTSKVEAQSKDDNHEDDDEIVHSEDEDFAESSDDEKPWGKDVKRQYQLVKQSKKMEEEQLEESRAEDTDKSNVPPGKPKFREVKDRDYSKTAKYMRQRSGANEKPEGNKEMTFNISKQSNRGTKKSKGVTRHAFKNLLRPARGVNRGRKRNKF